MEEPIEEEKEPQAPEKQSKTPEVVADSSSEVKEYQVQVTEVLKEVTLARAQMKEAKALVDALAEVCEAYSAAGSAPPAEEHAENTGAEDGAVKQDKTPDLESQQWERF